MSYKIAKIEIYMQLVLFLRRTCYVSKGRAGQLKLYSQKESKKSWISNWNRIHYAHINTHTHTKHFHKCDNTISISTATTLYFSKTTVLNWKLIDLFGNLDARADIFHIAKLQWASSPLIHKSIQLFDGNKPKDFKENEHIL